MDTLRRALLIAVLGGAAALAGGCGRPALVKSYQRENFTRRAMRFDDGLETRFRQHLFSSREGADGGYGHVGGGCGCN